METGTERKYSDATAAEILESRQRTVQHIIIGIFAVLLAGLLVSTQLYSLPFQEKLINVSGFGMLFAAAAMAAVLAISRKQAEKIDPHAGHVLRDEEFRREREVCPICGQTMIRQGFADTKLEKEEIRYIRDNSSAKECVYTHKRVCVYDCPTCGTVYGNSDVATMAINTSQMYIDGYSVKLAADTSYGSLWEVSFTLKEF